jgi:hypothetical protein
MLTPIETIALMVIILAAVKMVVILISPKYWMSFVKGFWSNVILVQIVSFVLAWIVLYYLLQQMSILQILAVVAFVALLLVFGIAPEVGFIFKKYEAQIKQGKLWKQYWFYALIWLILLMWGAYELLI